MIETNYKIEIIEQEPDDSFQITQGMRYMVTVGEIGEGVAVRELTDDVSTAVDSCFRQLVEVMKYR